MQVKKGQNFLIFMPSESTFFLWTWSWLCLLTVQRFKTEKRFYVCTFLATQDATLPSNVWVSSVCYRLRSRLVSLWLYTDFVSIPPACALTCSVSKKLRSCNCTYFSLRIGFLVFSRNSDCYFNSKPSQTIFSHHKVLAWRPHFSSILVLLVS